MHSALVPFLVKVGLVGMVLSGASWLAMKLDDGFARHSVRLVRLLAFGAGILLCLGFVLTTCGDGLTWHGILYGFETTAGNLIGGAVNPF